MKIFLIVISALFLCAVATAFCARDIRRLRRKHEKRIEEINARHAELMAIIERHRQQVRNLTRPQSTSDDSPGGVH